MPCPRNPSAWKTLLELLTIRGCVTTGPSFLIYIVIVVGIVLLVMIAIAARTFADNGGTQKDEPS